MIKLYNDVMTEQYNEPKAQIALPIVDENLFGSNRDKIFIRRVYTVHCTMYTTQCIVYSIQCTHVRRTVYVVYTHVYTHIQANPHTYIRTYM